MATSSRVAMSRWRYLLCTWWLTIIRIIQSQNCYPRNQCNAGYMDKTNGNMYYWACGEGCAGRKYYTDYGCGCACIPETSCIPTISPTTFEPTAATISPTTAAPTASPSDAPTAVPTTASPTLATAAPTTTTNEVLCYARGVCDVGYMDKTEGSGYYRSWSCDSECEIDGQKEYTDIYCNCACVEAPSSCPAADTSETLIDSITSGGIILPLIIIALVIIICGTLCRYLCRRSQSSYSKNMADAVDAGLPSNKWESTQTPAETIAMTPMHNIMQPTQPLNAIPQQHNIVPQQQQLPVMFITADQLPQIQQQQQQQVIYATPFNPQDAHSSGMYHTPDETEALPSYQEANQQNDGRNVGNEGEVTHL